MAAACLPLLCAGIAPVVAAAAVAEALPEAGYAGSRGDMVLIGAGSYRSLFTDKEGEAEVAVEAFYLDRFPVTNGEFSAFVNRHPEWRRGQARPIFADANYLQQFASGTLSSVEDQPVTSVSWFAASAYCESRGKRLPTVDEWERAGQASRTEADGTSDPQFHARILEWYGKPAILRLPDVQDTEPNYWGVHGMHGVVWEFVEDFNSALVTGESRADSQLDKNLYCGAGAASSANPGDYAAFMRYAMRSSYEGNYTMKSMGFRCAADVE